MVSSKRSITYFSRLYDATFGKWVLSHADEVIAVSEACEHFVRARFSIKNVRTIYRGITPTIARASRSDREIHIGYVGRLVDLK